MYNTHLLFDADGTLIQWRRKISSTYHECISGQGNGSGLRAVDSSVGRIGQLACWEHSSTSGASSSLRKPLRGPSLTSTPLTTQEGTEMEVTV